MSIRTLTVRLDHDLYVELVRHAGRETERLGKRVTPTDEVRRFIQEGVNR